MGPQSNMTGVLPRRREEVQSQTCTEGRRCEGRHIERGMPCEDMDTHREGTQVMTETQTGGERL